MSIKLNVFSYLGNISKYIGIEPKVVLGDVQVPLKQDISYKSTGVICNKERMVSLCRLVQCATVTRKAHSSSCFPPCCLPKYFGRWFLKRNVARVWALAAVWYNVLSPLDSSNFQLRCVCEGPPPTWLDARVNCANCSDTSDLNTCSSTSKCDSTAQLAGATL